MDRVHRSTDRQPSTIAGVGVGLYARGTHIGMLCRDSVNKPARFIHLAHHEDLRSEQDLSKCVLWVEARLEIEQADIIAAQARLIFRKNAAGGISYGYAPFSAFFSSNGAPKWNAPGNGLTCATFVLATFDLGGVRLISVDAWPTDRPDDKAFQLFHIQHLKKHKKAKASHLRGMEKDVGQVRVRVLEVAGAVSSEAYPADFTTSEANGIAIGKMLDPESPTVPAAI